MAEHQYYPEEVLIEKMERGEYGWLDYVNHFQPSGRRNIPAIARSTVSWWATNPLPSSSITKTSNWKRRWRTKMHNGNLFNNGLWRYERIPTPE